MRIGTFNDYRGILGSIEFNDGKHYGKLLNITDLVNYQADSLIDLKISEINLGPSICE